MKVKIRNKGSNDDEFTVEGVITVEVCSDMFYVKCNASGASYIGNYSLKDFDFEVTEDDL